VGTVQLNPAEPGLDHRASRDGEPLDDPVDLVGRERARRGEHGADAAVAERHRRRGDWLPGQEAGALPPRVVELRPQLCVGTGLCPRPLLKHSGVAVGGHRDVARLAEGGRVHHHVAGEQHSRTTT
jgi:hypothetical protein